MRCSAVGEIADLAGRRERGAPAQVARRDRARHVAQLDDRPRDGAREQPRQHERACQGDQTADQHVALRAADDLVEAARA